MFSQTVLLYPYKLRNHKKYSIYYQICRIFHCTILLFSMAFLNFQASCSKSISQNQIFRSVLWSQLTSLWKRTILKNIIDNLPKIVKKQIYGFYGNTHLEYKMVSYLLHSSIVVTGNEKFRAMSLNNWFNLELNIP